MQCSRKIITLSAILIFLASAIFLIILSGWLRGEEVVLDAEETAALFLIQPGRARKYYPKGDPDALPLLYHVFEINDLSEAHGNVARVIGYIGGPEYVAILRQIVDSFEGTLPGYRSDTMHGILEAWAVMARRGITEAEGEIRQWCTYRKWDEEFENLGISQKYEYSWSAIYVFGIYGDVDWRPLRDELLEGVEDEKIHRRISSYLSEDSMTEAIKKRRKDEASRVTKIEREKLRGGYNNILLVVERVEQLNEETQRGDNDNTAENITN